MSWWNEHVGSARGEITLAELKAAFDKLEARGAVICGTAEMPHVCSPGGGPMCAIHGFTHGPICANCGKAPACVWLNRSS